MTREQATDRLNDILKHSLGNLEVSHSDADTVLCELLISLGYGDIIALWNRVEKWYA